MVTQHERKFRRFKLKYRVRVNFQSGNTMAEVHAVTRNISLGGLLLESACAIPYLSPVEFTITAHGSTIFRPIQLRGAGEVVRVEPCETVDGFGIAVACSRPITQVPIL
jgi:PilZ domain-containing protein